MNHATRAALHRAGHCTLLEPQLWTLKPTLSERNAGLRANLLGLGMKGHPDCFVGVAVTFSTAPFFSPRTLCRRGTAAARTFPEKVHGIERALSTVQPGRSPLSPFPDNVSAVSARLVQFIGGSGGNWSMRRELEPSESGARLARQLSLSSQLYGLWLQVIPSQARHRLDATVFW